MEFKITKENGKFYPLRYLSNTKWQFFLVFENGRYFSKDITKAKHFNTLEEAEAYINEYKAEINSRPDDTSKGVTVYVTDSTVDNSDSYEVSTDGVINIINAKQFAKIAADINSGALSNYRKLVLVNDITLDKEWTPIGGSASYTAAASSSTVYKTDISTLTDVFNGEFDGNGHTIYGLKVSGHEHGEGGLFGICKPGCYFHDVTIESPTITNAKFFAGALVSYIGKVATSTIPETRIENCHVTGKINISGVCGIGGILGRVESMNAKVTISNCSVTGDAGSELFGTVSDSFTGTGAIVGAFYTTNATSSINNCTAKGLTIKSNSEGVGGIAGLLNTGIVDSCTIKNLDIYNGQPDNANKYYAEMIGIGALAGEIDAAINANTVASTYTSKCTINQNNIIDNIKVNINPAFTNEGSAAEIELDENGYPNWKLWSIVGCPRNAEHINPTSFVKGITDYDSLKANITVSKKLA